VVAQGGRGSAAGDGHGGGADSSRSISRRRRTG